MCYTFFYNVEILNNYTAMDIFQHIKSKWWIITIMTYHNSKKMCCPCTGWFIIRKNNLHVYFVLFYLKRENKCIIVFYSIKAQCVILFAVLNVDV